MSEMRFNDAAERTKDQEDRSIEMAPRAFLANAIAEPNFRRGSSIKQAATYRRAVSMACTIKAFDGDVAFYELCRSKIAELTGPDWFVIKEYLLALASRGPAGDQEIVAELRKIDDHWKADGSSIAELDYEWKDWPPLVRQFVTYCAPRNPSLARSLRDEFGCHFECLGPEKLAAADGKLRYFLFRGYIKTGAWKEACAALPELLPGADETRARMMTCSLFTSLVDAASPMTARLAKALLENPTMGPIISKSYIVAPLVKLFFEWHDWENLRELCVLCYKATPKIEFYPGFEAKIINGLLADGERQYADELQRYFAVPTAAA
jgi:hypothetical protein